MNIGIIEDNEIFAKELTENLSEIKKYEVLLVTNSVETYLEQPTLHQKIDIIFLDLMLPGVSGLDAIYLLKKENPEVIIIILTIKTDSFSIFKALRAGADGYLIKSPTLNLKEQLSIIEKGGSPVSASIARKVFEYFNPPKAFFLKDKKQKLTKKEVTVLKLLIEGLPHKTIAEKMEISVNGVYFHVKNIYKKLQVHSKIEVIKKYMDGLIEF